MELEDAYCHILFLFLNDTATTEIYTLSLHDALPIGEPIDQRALFWNRDADVTAADDGHADRKSTRLNSSHVAISYAVFCLKKKKKKENVHCIKKKKKKINSDK